MFRHVVYLIVAQLLMFPTAGGAETLWKVSGFAQPESALFDEVKKRIVVTNINGHPGKADGKGFLSLISADGRVIEREWVKGLDAPKGMALFGRELIVADLTKVHVINADSGKLIRSISVEGAVFLNDVSAGDGAVWITDLMKHSIYLYKDGKVSLWLNDKRLSHPNGILSDGKRLLIGSWGQGMQKDFSTNAPGGLFSVDIASKKIASVPGGQKIGNLDGVVRMGNKIIVNDWITGNVYELVEGKQVKKVLSLASGLADISGHGDVLYLPFMNDGVLEAYRYK